MAVQIRAINTLVYDPERCTGCGMCATVCPHGVFQMKGCKAALVRYEACIECGACQTNCPVDAISVDSGVGCASAFIYGILTGQEPTCDRGCCGNETSNCLGSEDSGCSSGESNDCCGSESSGCSGGDSKRRGCC